MVGVHPRRRRHWSGRSRRRPASPSRTPASTTGCAGRRSTRTATAWPGTCTTRSSRRLFALGLTLQGLAARLPETTASQLGGAVSEIDRVIAQVRSTIYELGMGEDSRGIRDDIAHLVRQLHEVVGFEVESDVHGPARRRGRRPRPRAPACHHPGGPDQRRQARPRDTGLGPRGGGRLVVHPDDHRRRRRPHRSARGRRAAVSGSRTCAGGRRSSTAPSRSTARRVAGPCSRGRCRSTPSPGEPA